MAHYMGYLAKKFLTAFNTEAIYVKGIKQNFYFASLNY